MSSSSSPPAGSSSSSSRGRATSARASATRFWTPYGRLPGKPVGGVGDAEVVERGQRERAQPPLGAVGAGEPEQRGRDAGPRLALGPDHHVLGRRQPGEQPDALQRAGDPEPGELVRANPVQHGLAEAHAAGVGAHEAADDVEERRLARAVGADHADDLAGRDRQRDVVERRQAAEAHRETVHLQHLCRFVARERRTHRRRAPKFDALVCVKRTIGRRRKEER